MFLAWNFSHYHGPLSNSNDQNKYQVKLKKNSDQKISLDFFIIGSFNAGYDSIQVFCRLVTQKFLIWLPFVRMLEIVGAYTGL